MIFFIVLDIFWTTEIFFLLLDAKLIEHYRLVHRKWENINTVTCVPRNSCSLSAEFVGLKKKVSTVETFFGLQNKANITISGYEKKRTLSHLRVPTHAMTFG